MSDRSIVSRSAFALVALLLLPAAIAAEEPNRFVADELSQLDISRPLEGRLVARYGSRVGNRLELDGTEIPVVLDPQAYFPALAEAKAARGLMELVVEPTDGRSLRVVDVVPCPGAREVFHAIESQWDERSTPRARAVLRWGFREAEHEGAAFLEELAARWNRHGSERIEDGRESALAWLRLGSSALIADPRWIEFANAVATKFEGDPAVIATLEELDLIQTEARWRPRRLFLGEVGLVQRGEETITAERSQLLDRMRAWKGSGQQATLLRGKTTAQYQRHVEAHEVVSGMEREEVVKSWGYPLRVTWERRDGSFYEGWSYRDKSVWLIDGWVFEAE